MKLRAIIFDFDGVICESVDVKTEAFYQIYLKHGIGVAQKVKAHHIFNGGMSRFEKFKLYHKEFLGIEITKIELKALSEMFSKIVVDKVIESDYVPGALEFIEENYQNYKLYICSATPVDEMNYISDRKNISKFFKGIYGSPENKIEIVKRIISENSYKPKEIVYIGDSLKDKQAAETNGVEFIARIYEKSVLSNEKYRIENIKRLGILLKYFSLKTK